MLTVSANGIDLIKRFEGLERSAYKCPAGVWTVGYGHTRGVKEGDYITDVQAEYYLEADISRVESDMDKLIKVPVTQNMYDALVSFCFNLGVSALAGSTLLHYLNDKQYTAAAREFFKWNHAGGKELAGLAARRDAEARLFTTGIGVLTYECTTKHTELLPKET